MKKCPYCAEEIQDDAIKCRHCGEWLDTKPSGRASDVHPEGNEPLRRPDDSHSHENIKKELPSESSLSQRIIATPSVEIPNDITGHLYKALIGSKNRIYYLTKFEEYDQRSSNLKASWNWAAFIFVGSWALYRKMYGWFFASLVFFFLIVIVDKNDVPLVSIVIGIPFWISFTVFANSLYYVSVKKKIAAAQISIRDETKLLEFLRYKGGVHTWVIWLFSLLPIAGILAAIIIPRIARP